MTTTYDAIIIGAGQAGPFLAQRLAASGTKVAIIERKLFGGTCVNTGCTPTKTMVASAYAAHTVSRAAEFGVVVGGSVSVDMKRIKARKDEVSGNSRIAVETMLGGLKNCTVYLRADPDDAWRTATARRDKQRRARSVEQED